MRVYERSRCESFAHAIRRNIVIGRFYTTEEAVAFMQDVVDDSYTCFAVKDDGTVVTPDGEEIPWDA